MIEPRDEFVTPVRASGQTPPSSATPIPETVQSVPGIPADAAPPAASDEPPVATEDQVKLVLRRVKDPELNLNVIDLGLIYTIAVEGSVVKVDMSLTSPGCPSGPEIMGDVERQLRTMDGVTDVQVNLVWTPYWTPDRIEPRVRAYLGF
jgi:metal-sulfur cluster biosynthetic enzyme